MFKTIQKINLKSIKNNTNFLNPYVKITSSINSNNLAIRKRNKT